MAYSAPNVFNPWRDTDPEDMPGNAPLARRNRLAAHLACNPKIILIGEAPGYRGCHFSGIPFTSEKLIMEDAVPRVQAFGRITSRHLPYSEGSATIMWETLYDIGRSADTVMWNAFAFHPHTPGNMLSNRTPTDDELRATLPILTHMLEAFPNARRIAVGRQSAKTLGWLGVPIHYEVRHPSMGGANTFRAQMAELA